MMAFQGAHRARDGADMPPHALDAEDAVLSACLLAGDGVAICRSILRPEHFFGLGKGDVFAAIVSLDDEGGAVDALTVAARLRDMGKAASAGGARELARIVDATPAVANVEDHARLVHDLWRLRQAESIAESVRSETRSGRPVQQILDSIGSRFGEVAVSHATKRSGAFVADAMEAEVVAIRAAGPGGKRSRGVHTGFAAFDEMTGGLAPKSMWVLAANTGCGKTSLALNIAANVAAGGMGVVFFSCEMPKEDLAARLICSEARVDVKKFRSGLCNEAEWAKLEEAAPWVKAMPIWIEDEAGMSVQTIKADSLLKQREMAADGKPLGLVVIDYLQLLNEPERKSDNREQVVTRISRGIKHLANALNVPVLVLSQLNDGSEKEQRAPRLNELRESRAIGHDADGVVMLNSGGHPKGIVEVIIRKQRQGPRGRFPLKFADCYTRFDNLEPGEPGLSEETPPQRQKSRWAPRTP